MIDSKLHWLRAACSKVCVCLIKSGRLLIYIISTTNLPDLHIYYILVVLVL